MTVSLAGTVLGASLSTPALGADQPPALPEHMECAATPGKPLHNVTAEDIAAAEKTLETH